MRNLYFLLFVCIIGFNSCSDKSKDVTKSQNTKFDLSLFNDFHHNEGSYWVYSIENSIQTDCTYIKSSAQLNEQYFAPWCQTCGYYQINSTQILDSYTTSTFPSEIYFDSCYIYFDYHPEITNLSPDFYKFGFRYENFAFTNGILLDSIILNSSVTINDVYKLTYDRWNEVSASSDTFSVYLKRNIGIVRKEIRTSDGSHKIYNLLRYTII
jgi:hypothetical protein